MVPGRHWSRFSRPKRYARPPETANGMLIGYLVSISFLCVALAVLGLAGVGLSPFSWYLTRTAGLLLYLSIWASVVLGLGLTTPLLRPIAERGIIHSLHVWTTWLAFGLLALHIVSLASDQYLRFAARDFLVPFTSEWREPWTGLGIIAAFLFLLVSVSSALRWVTGFTVWRLLHWLSFPLYFLALAHGIGAGSDTRHLWTITLYALTASTVLFMAIYRMTAQRGPSAHQEEPNARAFDRFTPD